MYERTKERYTGALLSEVRSTLPPVACRASIIPTSLVDLLNRFSPYSEWAPRVKCSSVVFQASTGADMAATRM